MSYCSVAYRPSWAQEFLALYHAHLVLTLVLQEETRYNQLNKYICKLAQTQLWNNLSKNFTLLNTTLFKTEYNPLKHLIIPIIFQMKRTKT